MVRLLDIDMPAPQLMPVLPYSLPKPQITGPATDNGYAISLSQEKSTVNFNKQLKAWQFRFNQLPTQAVRILIDPRVKSTSFEYKDDTAKLKKESTNLQGDMLGVGPEKKPTWWARMVSQYLK